MMRFLFLFDEKVKERVLSPKYLCTLITAFSLDVTWEYYMNLLLLKKKKKKTNCESLLGTLSWNFTKIQQF